MVNFKELSPWIWIIYSDPSSAFFKDTKRCKNYYALLYLSIMGEKKNLMFPIVFDLTRGNQSQLDDIEGPHEIYNKSYTPGNIKTLEEWIDGEFYRNLRLSSSEETEILDNALLDLGILVDKEAQIIKNTRNLSIENLEDYLYDNILDELNPWEV